MTRRTLERGYSRSYGEHNDCKSILLQTRNVRPCAKIRARLHLDRYPAARARKTRLYVQITCDCAKMSNLTRTLRPFLRCVRSQKRTYADAADNQMKFTFAGANQVFYDRAVIRQVDVPSFSGAFGILPKHVPTLAVLKPGVVTVYEEDGSNKKIFVSSGTVTINDDSSVQILAEEAHPVENLDNSAARDILSKAQQQLSSATSDIDKAEASIAVEVAEALVQATQ